MSKMIPIFYACDENFLKFAMVSLQSIIDNAAKNYDYVIHILHTDISEEMQQKVRTMATNNFAISFDNVSEYLTSINDKLPLRHYYSKTTYFRLFIAEMFPEYSKAIYIDSDTIVKGDISQLYNYDIGDNYVGAARELVMVQTEVYGTYAEKVVGINRNLFFNAGLLLLNCDEFRKNKLLDKFIELLYTYNFIVTQDEDYLNVICRDKVYWLPQQWNTEAFCDITYPEEEFKMIHYIMTSKPWHYEGCKYGTYFWEYAKKTTVYQDIKQILENYTDEERERDSETIENLEKMAQSEIAREDNFHNIMMKKTNKSPDRIKILNKIARYELEGRFDEDVEDDPPGRELLPDEVDYLQKKLRSKIKSKYAYAVARKFVNNLIQDKKLIIKNINGIEHFKNLNSGAVITCNHFNAFDSFAIQLTYEAAEQKNRKFYRVIREGNYTSFPGFYGLLMRNCNTLPLSSNKKTMQKFLAAVDKVLKEGHFVLVYPEQSMWWNYRKPKPLKKGAYIFATKSNVPVLPCFITMKDSDIIDDDGFNVQEYEIHVGEPIYPEPGLSRAQNVERMRNKNYEAWKNIYEKEYAQPLVYTCGDIFSDTDKAVFYDELKSS